MKLILFAFLLPLVLSFSPDTTNDRDPALSVNAVLGDISYVSKYGHRPTTRTDEHDRIQTHLAYVETLLRQKEVNSLTSDQRRNRAIVLDLLHDYWTAGEFPKNNLLESGRSPCFIDEEGAICAVGYLVEQTAGRAAAENINAKFQYKEILSIDDPILDSWIESSGLSKEECAMIQPAYGPSPDYRGHIDREYGISSAALTGASISLTTMNGIQLIKGRGNAVVPAIGLAVGLGQIISGAANYPAGSTGGFGYKDRQADLSMVNIAVGTTTVMMSIWNLATRPVKEKATSWNVYSFATEDGRSGVGLGLVRRF